MKRHHNALVFRCRHLCFVLLASAAAIAGAEDGIPPMVVTYPQENPDALINPLKGFRPNIGEVESHEYGTLARHYIRWNEIENDESDTIQKIKNYCDQQWVGFPEAGIKVIPRVYLDWSGDPGNEYWPADMTTGDYSSEQFKQRLVRLIHRLGECWNDDPRVAWIQMGLIGYWGEHHHPEPDAELQQLLGDAFTEAFPDKKFLVRRPGETFLDYHVGGYWDRWADSQQMESTRGALGIQYVNQLDQRWKSTIFEGEVGYGSPYRFVQPGDNPDDTLTDPLHLDFLNDSIRDLHCNGLGWISTFTGTDIAVCAGAREVQKTFGYRFLIPYASWTGQVDAGEDLRVIFKVRNTGSTPFYHRWPLELSLLDKSTRLPVWKTLLYNVDIRQWLPGDNWQEEGNYYQVPAEDYTVEVSLPLPVETLLPTGEYILALAVVEPVGRDPAVRFAIRNYYNGGRHPLGLVGVRTSLQGTHELDPSTYDDPRAEGRLPYKRKPPDTAASVAITATELVPPSSLLLSVEGSGALAQYVILRSQDLHAGNWDTVGFVSVSQPAFQWEAAMNSAPSSVFYKVVAE